MLMLRVHYDESADRHAYSIGGCVASYAKWERLEPDWKATLNSFGVKELHMKNFAHFRGEYACWTEERRQAFLGIMLTLMDRDVDVYVGAAMSRYAFEALEPEERAELLDEPYFPCFQECMHGAALQALHLPPEEVVQIVMARHPIFRPTALRLYLALTEYYETKPHIASRLGGISFDDPIKFVQLQAADLVAYEIRKMLSDRLTNSGRNIRYPMRRLLAKGMDAMFKFYVSPDDLRAQMQAI